MSNTRGLTECLLSTPSLHFLLPSLAQLSKCHLNHLLTPKVWCVNYLLWYNSHTQCSGVRFLISPLLWVRVSPGCTESRGQPCCSYLKTQRGDLFPSSLMWLMVASGPHWRMPETWKGPRGSSQCGSSFPQRESGPQPARRKSQRER